MSYTNNFDSKTSNLLQLTEIVTPKKLSKLDILDPNGTTKANQLYRLLTEGEITTEEGLMDALFDKGPHQRGNFNRVKRQLEEKLVNTLFLVNNNNINQSDLARVYHQCLKNATAIKILLSKGARFSAMHIAEKTLNISELYEFSEVSLFLSKELMLHYGSVVSDKKKFLKYENRVSNLIKIYNAETKGESYFSNFVLKLALSRASKQEFSEVAKNYSQELSSIIHSLKSYKLYFLNFHIAALGNELANEYEEAVLTCQKAIQYFKKTKFKATKHALLIFHFRKIPSLILLGRLQEAELTSYECLKLTTEGYSNWYKTLELRFIIYLHLQRYQKAFEAYISAISHKSFSKQFPNTREAWYIYEAYMYYFHSKKNFNNPLTERLKKFRVSRFLNEVPIYSKDKKGLNISILILQVLFLLHQKQYGKIIDRTEALRTYTHRYLRRDETFRSNCFIKMLMQLPKANFHRAAVERKTKELREKLSSVGIIQNQSAEVEIVPYEVLWEFVLESLDNKIH